jgi:hypothetical protein
LGCVPDVFLADPLLSIAQFFSQSKKNLVGPLDPLPLVGVQGRPGAVSVFLYHPISSRRRTSGSLVFRL